MRTLLYLPGTPHVGHASIPRVLGGAGLVQQLLAGGAAAAADVMMVSMGLVCAEGPREAATAPSTAPGATGAAGNGASAAEVDCSAGILPAVGVVGAVGLMSGLARAAGVVGSDAAGGGGDGGGVPPELQQPDSSAGVLDDGSRLLLLLQLLTRPVLAHCSRACKQRISACCPWRAQRGTSLHTPCFVAV